MKVTKEGQEILWTETLLFVFISSGFIYGLYFILTGEIGRYTTLFTFIFFLLGGIGNGPGAHRLFSHHSYKPVRLLKIFIIFCQQLSSQKSIISWVRLHRTHHKFSDTEFDPPQIHRGLFYSSIGFALITYPPKVQKEIDRIYLDDLFADKDVVFQHKYYSFFYMLITLGLPTFIPYFFWNESIYIAFIMNLFRIFLNIAQQIIGNGPLHYNGTRPYDKTNTSVDNVFYNFLLLGEGYHNFHHAFPFDYRSSEAFGLKNLTSVATMFIDICAWLGLVTNRKVAPPHMIAKRILKSGDGSHPLSKQTAADRKLWGYGDVDMSAEDKKFIDENGNLDY